MLHQCDNLRFTHPKIRLVAAWNTSDTMFRIDTQATGTGSTHGNQTRPPHKRVKIAKPSAAGESEPRFAPSAFSEGPATLNQENATSQMPAPILPPELSHLQTKYDFTTMSIISSSKIEQKVRNLLMRLENFSFADVNAKPGVIVLHAKANVVAKMISIIEIAKKNITDEGGKWWQYSRLHGQIAELKEKPETAESAGKTLVEWDQNRASLINNGVEASLTGNGFPAGQPTVGIINESAGDQVEEEVVFETMKEKKKHGDPSKAEALQARKKIRAVPVMTIYMSRVPIGEFKERYG